MTGLIIFMCVLSAIFLFGMIGDRNEKNRTNYTYAFCACILAIAVIALKF